MEDDFDTEELLCRPCAVKKYGEAYLLNVEEGVEEDDRDEK
jgi:hypothetical protein